MAENIIHVQFSGDDIIKILSGFRCDKCNFWVSDCWKAPTHGICYLQEEDGPIVTTSESGCTIYTTPDFFCKSFTPLV